jgi:hypothetical protein
VFLHNTEERRPKRKGKADAGAHVIIVAFRLVFSSVRSAQDIFKLMRVPPGEAEGIAAVQAFLVPARLYAASVANRATPLTVDQPEDAIR